MAPDRSARFEYVGPIPFFVVPTADLPSSISILKLEMGGMDENMVENYPRGHRLLGEGRNRRDIDRLNIVYPYTECLSHLRSLALSVAKAHARRIRCRQG
jgi:hypothetical protein